ncbi:MAG: hypothetical protein WCF65_04015 [Parachlamydiaceae bacterium]
MTNHIASRPMSPFINTFQAIPETSDAAVVDRPLQMAHSWTYCNRAKQYTLDLKNRLVTSWIKNQETIEDIAHGALGAFALTTAAYYVYSNLFQGLSLPELPTNEGSGLNSMWTETLNGSNTCDNPYYASIGQCIVDLTKSATRSIGLELNGSNACDNPYYANIGQCIVDLTKSVTHSIGLDMCLPAGVEGWNQFLTSSSMISNITLPAFSEMVSQAVSNTSLPMADIESPLENATLGQCFANLTDFVNSSIGLNMSLPLVDAVRNQFLTCPSWMSNMTLPALNESLFQVVSNGFSRLPSMVPLLGGVTLSPFQNFPHSVADVRNASTVFGPAFSPVVDNPPEPQATDSLMGIVVATAVSCMGAALSVLYSCVNKNKETPVLSRLPDVPASPRPLQTLNPPGSPVVSGVIIRFLSLLEVIELISKEIVDCYKYHDSEINAIKMNEYLGVFYPDGPQSEEQYLKAITLSFKILYDMVGDELNDDAAFNAIIASMFNPEQKEKIFKHFTDSDKAACSRLNEFQQFRNKSQDEMRRAAGVSISPGKKRGPNRQARVAKQGVKSVQFASPGSLATDKPLPVRGLTVPENPIIINVQRVLGELRNTLKSSSPIALDSPAAHVSPAMFVSPTGFDSIVESYPVLDTPEVSEANSRRPSETVINLKDDATFLLEKINELKGSITLSVREKILNAFQKSLHDFSSLIETDPKNVGLESQGVEIVRSFFRILYKIYNIQFPKNDKDDKDAKFNQGFAKLFLHRKPETIFQYFSETNKNEFSRLDAFKDYRKKEVSSSPHAANKAQKELQKKANKIKLLAGSPELSNEKTELAIFILLEILTQLGADGMCSDFSETKRKAIFEKDQLSVKVLFNALYQRAAQRFPLDSPFNNQINPLHTRKQDKLLNEAINTQLTSEQQTIIFHHFSEHDKKSFSRLEVFKNDPVATRLDFHLEGGGNITPARSQNRIDSRVSSPLVRESTQQLLERQVEREHHPALGSAAHA